MRRFTVIACLIACLLVLTSLPSWGDNPQFQFANASINTTTACYSVSFKEVGLGNATGSTAYTLSCSTIDYTVACVTKKGNIVQGEPKSGTTSGESTGSFPIRNGQTTGTLQICPSDADTALPDPGCTGNQKQVILSASYSGCTLTDAFGNFINTDPLSF